MIRTVNFIISGLLGVLLGTGYSNQTDNTLQCIADLTTEVVGESNEEDDVNGPEIKGYVGDGTVLTGRYDMFIDGITPSAYADCHSYPDYNYKDTPDDVMKASDDFINILSPYLYSLRDYYGMEKAPWCYLDNADLTSEEIYDNFVSHYTADMLDDTSLSELEDKLGWIGVSNCHIYSSWYSEDFYDLVRYSSDFVSWCVDWLSPMVWMETYHITDEADIERIHDAVDFDIDFDEAYGIYFSDYISGLNHVDMTLYVVNTFDDEYGVVAISFDRGDSIHSVYEFISFVCDRMGIDDFTDDLLETWDRYKDK